MLNNRFPDRDAFVSQSSLNLALAASGIAAWQVDPRSRELEFTSVLNDIVEIPSDKKIDYAGFMNLLHPDDRDYLEKQIEAALNPEGDGDYQAEYRIVTPRGAIKWLSATGKVYFTDAVPNLFIGTLRDDSTRKELEIALQAAFEQKQALVHEVNHRVKNSLQLVSSLLRLQTRRIADPTAKRQLEDSVSRISTIAHIHQRLYRDQNVEQIDFGAFLSELCADLQGSSPQCQLKVTAPRGLIAADQAIPLALIVNELVTNAFKYAYPGGGGVTVEVEHPIEDNILIRVSDRGIGLADDFSIASTDSFGMILIGSLLGQLSGKLNIEKTNGGGATFVVTAPVHMI